MLPFLLTLVWLAQGTQASAQGTLTIRVVDVGTHAVLPGARLQAFCFPEDGGAGAFVERHPEAGVFVERHVGAGAADSGVIFVVGVTDARGELTKPVPP